MKISLLKISGVLVVGVLMVGCSQVTESLVEAGTGADVEISEEGMTITGEDGSTMTIDEDGGSVTYSDEEGTTSVQSGDDVQIPAGVPGDLPLPEGATLVSASENDGFYILLWAWQGLDKDQLNAYVSEVQSAGYSNKSDVVDLDLGEGAFNSTYVLSDGTNDITLAALSDSEGYGQLSMSVGPTIQ